MGFFNSDKIKVREVDVYENEAVPEAEDSFIGKAPEENERRYAPQWEGKRRLTKDEIKALEREDTWYKYTKSGKRKPKYGWVFFLACLFGGGILSDMTNIDAFQTGGLIIGFMFYVDPIYDAVVRQFSSGKS